ncbi:flagellar biosynthesis anti-sigma factor FlgM [Thioclava sp. 15-R06ZXC-3]|uniref:Flagellar biosynthesis anti-sigma factor FlgM n=1 Tax=Thioclava arctica TaxID=3238301 RepID=A0ABV3TNV8_9RHOB
MIKISGATSGSIPLDQSTSAVGPAAEPAAPEAGEGTNPVQSGETVSLSERATDAAALYKGVAAADRPEGDPQIQQLMQSVAEGSYRPDSSKVAKALLSFERLVARKLGSD